jgi:DNA-binding GntR family transcriptional regulator
MDDQKDKALLVLEKMGKKSSGDFMGEPEGDDEEPSLDAADALRDMYAAMKSGDFDAAAAALEAAMTACGA